MSMCANVLPLISFVLIYDSYKYLRTEFAVAGFFAFGRKNVKIPTSSWNHLLFCLFCSLAQCQWHYATKTFKAFLLNCIVSFLFHSLLGDKDFSFILVLNLQWNSIFLVPTVAWRNETYWRFILKRIDFIFSLVSIAQKVDCIFQWIHRFEFQKIVEENWHFNYVST